MDGFWWAEFLGVHVIPVNVPTQLDIVARNLMILQTSQELSLLGF
jgi:hypothetical protein